MPASSHGRQISALPAHFGSPPSLPLCKLHHKKAKEKLCPGVGFRSAQQITPTDATTEATTNENTQTQTQIQTQHQDDVGREDDRGCVHVMARDPATLYAGP